MKLHFKFFFSVILLIYSNFSFSQGGCIGGTVTTLSPTVNYGNNTTLTLNVPTGSFLWQYSSDNSNWQNVSGGSVININNTATSTTSSFSYTGALQTFEVPAGVTSINADGIGAAGGHGYSDDYGIGGLGGQLIANLTTIPGEILNIYVGGIGKDGWNMGIGGFNGGGTNPGAGGGGGGGTDIRQGGVDLNNRIFVVGGGGGGGAQIRRGNNGGNGGNGGGLIGQNGFIGIGSSSSGGGGGTQNQGGAKGGNDNGTAGDLWIGGNGGGSISTTIERVQRSGGGGGGGYYGGGGGENGNGLGGGGGGGGSSYSSGTITTNTQGYSSATGDGSLVLSYTIPASVTSNYTTSLTSPTYFRAAVTSGGGCVAYSTSTFIVINPYITISNPLATLTSCYGTSSTPSTFGVTGSNLTASVTISAPSNFEVSTSSVGTYSSSLTLTNTSTVSQTLYIRLNSSATVGSKIGTITATSTDATDVITTISGTVNSLPNIGISGTTTNPELVSLTATASEGSTYAWSDGSSTSTASNTFDASGLYSLSVTDANGCISSTQLNITVQQYGLSRTGEKTLDSTRQISSSGQIGSLNPISQDGKKKEYKRKVKVGDSYRGGIVAYIFQSVDAGYIDDGQQHGLIAALDHFGPSIWGPNLLINGTSSSLNSGGTNTTIIYNALKDDVNYSTYAISFVKNYRGGGYNDWFLPSKDELHKINNSTVLTRIGYPFAISRSIWSSTTMSSTQASAEIFINASCCAGNTDPRINIGNEYYVIPMRYF